MESTTSRLNPEWLGQREPGTDGRSGRTVSRTLVVGFGGTGCLAAQWALWHVRRRFQGRRLPVVEFLVFDTTTEESEIATNLEVGDFVNIAGFNSNWYFRHAADFPYLTWLSTDEFVPGEINVGAHGRPHIGRLCYFMHREGLIKRAVEAKLDKLTDPCLVNALDRTPGAAGLRLEHDAIVTVHLIASVFGGTGAGCLLDAAYDLRQWCEQRTGHAPRIVAHLLLPEAFQLRCSPAIHRQHRATAYALLAQINHFMGPHGVRVQYKTGREVAWAREVAPFDFCYLLDGSSGKTTTNRERICRDVGRMTALLAVEYAGKRISDRSINLYRGLDLQGADSTELRVYSSYGVGVARRPSVQAEEVLRRKLFETLGRLGTRDTQHAEVQYGRWVGTLQAELYDPERVKRTLLEPLNKFIGRVVQWSKKPNAIEAAGTQFIEEVGKFRNRALERARDDFARRGKAWLDRGGARQLLEQILEPWREQGEQVTALPAYLESLRDQLGQPDQYVPPVAPRPDVRQDADRLLQDLPGKVIEEGRRQLVVAAVEKELDHALELGWKLEFDALAHKLHPFAAGLAARAADLAQRCRAEHAQIVRRAARQAAAASDGEDLRLYNLDEKVVDDHHLGHVFHAELKRIALELILGEAPPKGFAAAIESMLTDSSPLRQRLANALHDHFTKYEEESLARGGEPADAERLLARLQQLKDNASPRWLRFPDQPVERVSCMTYPESLPLAGLTPRVSDHDLEAISDPAVEEVTMFDVEHGGAISDLLNLGLYEDAFEESLERRTQVAEQCGRTTFHESEMWLDRRWKVARPPCRGARPQSLTQDLPALTFGLGLAQDRIRTDGGGFVLIDPQLGVARRPLGENLRSAFAAWCSPDWLADVHAAYEALVREPEPVLLRLAERALKHCAAKLDADRPEDLDEPSRDILQRIERAVRTQWKTWKINQSIAAMSDEPPAYQAAKASAPSSEASPT